MPVPHAAVRFELDSEKVYVPQSFIQDFNKSDFFPGMKASVFWSPKEGESPTDIERAQGIVIKVDSKEKRKHKSGLPGYYDAEIIQIADSEAELEKKMNLKRTSISSKKAAEAKQEKALKNKHKNSRRSNKNQSYVSKAKRKKFIKNSEKITSQSWKKYDDSSSNSPSSDEELLPASHFKTEVRKLTAENDGYRKRIEKLENELEETRVLNRFWQNKFAGSSSPDEDLNLKDVTRNLFGHEESSSNSVVASPNNGIWRAARSKSIVQQQEAGSRKRSQSPSKMSSDSVVIETVTATPAKKIDSKELTPESNTKLSSPIEISSNGSLYLTPSKASDARLKASPKQQKEIESSYKITPRKIKFAGSGLYKGKKDDKKFVKNLAMSIFGRDVLVNSTFTGKPALGGKKSTTKADEETVKRDALCPKKLKALKSAFKKRIRAENPKPSKEEEVRRLGCIRDAISEKIKYLRNSQCPQQEKDSPGCEQDSVEQEHDFSEHEQDSLEHEQDSSDCE